MNRDTLDPRRSAPIWLLVLAIAAGCARPPAVPGPDGAAHAAPLVQTADAADDDADYDPWQPFNEVMFSFNHDVLDRFLVKPAATGWQAITPLPVRQCIARAFDNLDMPRRLVNNVLQLRPVGAGREVARFALNSSVGLAGLFDVATMVHVDKSDADTGQTLALYGVPDGPYLVLPTLEPSTARDAVGRAADGMLDPLGYFLPFVANRVKGILSAVNERSLNLKLYANVEDSVLDLYSAARNGYLQRRHHVVERAIADRGEQWRWAFRSTEPDEHPTALAAAPTERDQQPAAPAATPTEADEHPAAIAAETHGPDRRAPALAVASVEDRR